MNRREFIKSLVVATTALLLPQAATPTHPLLSESHRDITCESLSPLLLKKCPAYLTSQDEVWYTPDLHADVPIWEQVA